jgi:hypothetical protein
MIMKNNQLCLLLSVIPLIFLPLNTLKAQNPKPVHIWEKVDVTFTARNIYKNPYKDVTVWVDLKGPGFEKRCYGFWDGGNTFRVRITATAPGNWSWKSGSQPADPGLADVIGNFSATDWTEEQKAENPSRRGMILSSSNGHAFQYADGTAYFLVGDTWWATPTYRFRWHDDDTIRQLGPEAGFKEFVAYRRKQEFNCVAILAALPNWQNDDQPAKFKTKDGTILRAAWVQAGTNSAKSMTDENGHRAFLFPGKIPGYESYFPDVERIDPEYFQSLDKKIDYLNAQGFVPFIEIARRDIGQAWKKYYPWPESYVRYIQYIWSRYQANICLFSPIHFDYDQETISASDWNSAANEVIDEYGHPPFGTSIGTNPTGSSLRNWGHTDKARWLTFHQIGNAERTHDSYSLLTEIFNTRPPVPGINGEPYYDGMENAEGGSKEAALWCRSAMYGSVLSGGLGGHIYGAGGWKGGIWSGEVESASENPMWKEFLWPSGDQMRFLKAFILSSGKRYQDLVPCTERIKPNQSAGTKVCSGWAYGSTTPEQDLMLLYFEKDCPKAIVMGVKPKAKYSASWFDPRDGKWISADSLIVAEDSGQIILPPFPDKTNKSDMDWAIKLTLVQQHLTNDND